MSFGIAGSVGSGIFEIVGEAGVRKWLRFLQTKADEEIADHVVTRSCLFSTFKTKNSTAPETLRAQILEQNWEFVEIFSVFNQTQLTSFQHFSLFETQLEDRISDRILFNNFSYIAATYIGLEKYILITCQLILQIIMVVNYQYFKK